jgi:hypothetical protein
MALPISVTYTFATATSAIPLSQLDANFTTVVNGINGIGNGTNALANVLITGGTIDNVAVGTTTSSTGRFSTITATTGNITTVNATTLNAATHRSDTTLTFQSNVSTTAMTIDASQNVGIGTTTAGYGDLTVRRTATTGTNSTISIVSGSAASSRLFFGNTQNAAGEYDGFIQYDQANRLMQFGTAQLERMRIDSSGNVGIGTSSPGAKLELNGKFYINSTNSGDVCANLVNSSATGYGLRTAGGASGAGYIAAFNDYAGTNRMIIDGSGNVGIGTSSPANKLNISGTGAYQLKVADTGGTGGTIQVVNASTGTASTDGVLFGYDGSNDVIINNQEATALKLYTSGSERARIDSSGNFLFGVTADPSGSGNNGASFFKATNNYEMHSRSGVTTTSYVGIFYNPNGTVGSISTNGSVTTYSTLSDYRLKNDVQPVTTGLATVSALKPVTYKWNADNSVGEGFIAHELQEIIPLAVSGEKDALNEDGSIKPQGVDYSKIVVHLVAAIQELSAKVAALEAK